ncbi:MAG: hypothetical protein KJP09_08455 [Bacteroidia bacterium]|nr:hypothetical protein [Bacteroidia bacterium]
MRTILLLALVICCATPLQAQETYTVNGESYELKTEVSGTIDLLWNIIDNNYRYFIRKNNSIKELVNTKNDNGKYKEEYLNTLREFMADSEMDYSKVKLLLYSLKDFVNTYNAAIDPSYVYNTKKISVKTRLGFSGGITNNPFVDGPENDITPLLAAELELYDDNTARRHGAFLGLRHAFENETLNYSVTELSLGYRYRFILQEKFNIYANLKLATFSASKGNFSYTDSMNQIVTEERSNSNFDAPVIFGLGADIKVGENGFLTLSYGELFALFLENQGNFSTDLSVGYKFNL